MQRMSKLMEHGLHLVDVEIMVQIADVDNNRAHHLAVGIHILLAHIVHPGTASLTLTRQEVGRINTQQRTIGIIHTESLHHLIIV